MVWSRQCLRNLDKYFLFVWHLLSSQPYLSYMAAASASTCTSFGICLTKKFFSRYYFQIPDFFFFSRLWNNFQLLRGSASRRQDPHQSLIIFDHTVTNLWLIEVTLVIQQFKPSSLHAD